MFKIFSKIKNKNTKLVKKDYIKPDINILFKIKQKNNIKHMQILENHNVKEHFEYLNDLNEFNDFNYRLAIFKDGFNFFDKTIVKQDIYIISYNNIVYVVSYSKEEIKISISKKFQEDTYETTLDIDKRNDNYCIGKYIHDSIKSTKFNRWYPYDWKGLELKEKEAKNETSKLLIDLNNNNILCELLDLEYITTFLKSKTGWDIFETNKIKQKK